MVDAAELPPSDEAVAEPAAEAPVVESEPVAAEAWFIFWPDFATFCHHSEGKHFMVPSPLP